MRLLAHFAYGIAHPANGKHFKKKSLSGFRYNMSVLLLLQYDPALTHITRR
jgi:hypothetical protein